MKSLSAIEPHQNFESHRHKTLLRRMTADAAMAGATLQTVFIEAGLSHRRIANILDHGQQLEISELADAQRVLVNRGLNRPWLINDWLQTYLSATGQTKQSTLRRNTEPGSPAHED